MKNNQNSSEKFGEFKGSTETTLKQILFEVQEMRLDIKDLQGWKSYSLGIGAAAGFIAAFFKDLIIKR